MCRAMRPAFHPENPNILVLLGDDYQSTIYFIDVETGKIVNYETTLLGSETDGLTFWNNNGDGSHSKMFVGLNRIHSHEQVLGDAPMVSIIQLEQQQV